MLKFRQQSPNVENKMKIQRKKVETSRIKWKCQEMEMSGMKWKCKE